VNAYHQPGVEAGKKAASALLALQARVVAALGPQPRGAEALAVAAGAPDEAEAVLLLCEHLAANGRARQEGHGAAARFAAPAA
jgi:glucose-6-phosphate isomerase